MATRVKEEECRQRPQEDRQRQSGYGVAPDKFQKIENRESLQKNQFLIDRKYLSLGKNRLFYLEMAKRNRFLIPRSQN